MKKVLVIFLSVLLVFSSMSISLLPTIAVTTVDAYKTNFFFDFSEEQSYATDVTWVRPDRWAVNGNLFKPVGATTASVSYDTENKALKLQGNGSAVVDLDIHSLDRRAGMAVRNHTALAMKVKLSDTSALLQSASMGLHDGNTAATATNLYDLNTVPAYANTTDWQLVVIDLSSANWSQALTDIDAACSESSPNNWWAAHVNMAQAGYTAPIYVEWVAVFEDAEAAANFYNNVPPVYKTVYYFDFSSQEKFTDMTDFGVDGNTERPRTQVNMNNNNIPVSTYSTVSYDESNEAMKVTSTNSSSVQLDLMCLDWRAGLDYKTYKTLALKVKLSDTNATFMAATIRANDGAASATASSLHDLVEKPTYTDTTDWQLVLIDLDSSNWKQSLIDIEAANNTAGTTSNWWGTRLVLAQEGYTGEIYVKWAGIFKNAAKAEAHYIDDASNESEEPTGGPTPIPTTAPTPVPEDPDQLTSKFLFDFTTQETYTDMTNFRFPATDTTNPRTMVNQLTNPLDITKYGAVSFDSEKGALKLVGDGTNAPTFDLRCLDWRAGLDITKHTVIALKMKLDDSNTTFRQAQMYANDGAVSANDVKAGNILRLLPSVPAYAKTTDWQLVIVDISSENYDDTLKIIASQNETAGTVSNWWGTCLTLGQAGHTAPIYVAWAGIFQSEGKALAYYAETTPNVKTNYLFDFSDQGKYTDMTDYGVGGNTTSPRTIVNTNNNTPSSTYSTISYDDTNKAMKVSATNNAAVQLDMQCLDWRTGLDYKNNRTLALKVKLSNPNAVFQSAAVRVNDGAAASTANNLHELTRMPKYEESTDWQLIIIDLDDANWKDTLKNIDTQNTTAGTTSNWWGTRLGLAQAGYTGDIYVQWAGIFSNESNAVAYFLNTTPGLDLSKISLSASKLKRPVPTKFFYDFSSEAVYNENIENPRVNVGFAVTTKASYDATQKAIKLENTDTAAMPYLELTSSDRTLNINTGHILAVKIKISSPLAVFQSARMYAKDDASVDSTIGGNDSIEDPQMIKNLKSYPNYIDTVGWQLLLVDLSDDNRFEDLANKTGVWYGTRLTLTGAGAFGPFYIAWAGVFNNETDATAYFDYTTTENDDATFGEETDPLNGETPSPVFWNFFVKSGMKKAERKGDTYLDFDSTLSAMKVEVKDMNDDGAVGSTPGSIALGTLVPIEEGATLEDYPIFAVRVKLSRADIPGGMLRIVSALSREYLADGMLDSADLDIDILNYRATEEWQTIVIDYRNNMTASFFSGGDWKSVTLNLVDQNQVVAQDAVYLQWAGAFASVEELNNFLISINQYNDNSEGPGDNGESPQTGDPIVSTTAAAMLITVTAAAALIVCRKSKKCVQKY